MLTKTAGKVGDFWNRVVKKQKQSTAKELISKSSPGKFFLITGVGHCGTAWLANVLHRPDDGLVCYHEYKNHIVDINWKESLQYEFNSGVGDLFDRYWAFMNEQLRRYHYVGDSNSWTMYMLPKVAAKLEPDRIIYLVRNGIQNVHSAFQNNRSIPRTDWLYTHFFRRYWELLDRPGGDWDIYDDWACWCFWWQLNHTMPTWLANQLGPEKVVVYKFEDLLQDTDVLLRLIQQLHPSNLSISGKELKLAQQTDINRKVQGDRSSETLWSSWTDEQRAVFIRICGPGMKHYNYPIPS